VTFATHAAARFDGVLPDDLLPHLASHLRDAELEVEAAPAGLTVRTPLARMDLARDAAGLSVGIKAEDAQVLQQVREYLLFLFDHVSPGTAEALRWSGEIARNRAPLNFHLATVVGTRRVGTRFLRVELSCPGTAQLASGRGMHFSLLLPPEGRAPVWPRLDDNGRTVWPAGEAALHRAVYTFVDLDPAAGRFTFDVFEHEGGRATGWAQTARPGQVVGITGPGSGGFPPGRDMLIAGDETALPAIRRILAHSAPDRRGDVFVEVGSPADRCEMPGPEGMALTWLFRDRGETLWDRLKDRAPPEGPDRYVWIAAEQELVRKAKARFKTELGVGAQEGYFAYFWTA